ncbi:MAG: HTTM domain-containing protein [Flavobacteriales bacterium]|nr:HTTM domain-containing protein [Flavobacteriales bacterium]
MRLAWRSIRLLQRAVHLWLFGYLLSALPAAEWLWDFPVVPPLPPPPGLLSPLTHAFSTWLPQAFAIPSVLLLLVLALRGVFARSYWWITLLEWVLFSGLMNLAWLAASGGHQLIANVLFWMIFLPGKEPLEVAGKVTATRVMHTSAFWIIRFQLLLAYAVTGIQKLSGSYWISGEAVRIVSTDADYGPAFIAALPFVGIVVNYGVLLFQLTFPLAVWRSDTRSWWMWAGVFFHLLTGITFGILDMGTAFLAVYPVWFGGPSRVEAHPEFNMRSS